MYSCRVGMATATCRSPEVSVNMLSNLRNYPDDDRTDPRRNRRGRSDRDRHTFTADEVQPSPIATALAHVGLTLRTLRQRLHPGS